MEDLAKRFEENTGYAILGQLVQIILDSDRLEFYDRTRVIEAVEMAPEYFYDRFVNPALDKIADTLESGFREVDATDCEHNNESVHEDGQLRCDDCGDAM